MPSNHHFRYNSDSSLQPDDFKLAHFKTNGKLWARRFSPVPAFETVGF